MGKQPCYALGLSGASGAKKRWKPRNRAVGVTWFVVDVCASGKQPFNLAHVSALSCSDKPPLAAILWVCISRRYSARLLGRYGFRCVLVLSAKNMV